MKTPAALRDLSTDRVNQVVFATVALMVGVGYSVMLPYAYTQRVSFRNW